MDTILGSMDAPVLDPDCDWSGLEELDDGDLHIWCRYIDSANTDHNYHVASIAEDIVTPCKTASKGERYLHPKQIKNALIWWVNRFEEPYATLKEKTAVAVALDISVVQVNNFLNNHRKRYTRVGGKQTSFNKFASSQYFFTHCNA
jgi:hypothetical protein